MIKLSICIPTYNRGAVLQELLDSILDQVRDEHSIEVCISDNASTDDTMKVVRDFQKIYKNTTFFRFGQNKGAPTNFLKAVDLAKGEYCWLMGSDDVINTGKLQVILSYLNQDYDLITGNHILCDRQMKELPNRKYPIEFLKAVISNTCFNLTDEKDLKDYMFRAASGPGVFSYMSVLIFKRDKWAQVKIPVQLSQNWYIHAYVLLSFLKTDSFKVFYLRDFLIRQRCFNDSFLQKDLARRKLADLIYYKEIADALFSKNSLQYQFVMHVIGVELKFSCSRFRSLLHIRAESNKRSFSELTRGLAGEFREKNQFGYKSRVSFFLARLFGSNKIFEIFLKQLNYIYVRYWRGLNIWPESQG